MWENPKRSAVFLNTRTSLSGTNKHTILKPPKLPLSYLSIQVSSLIKSVSSIDILMFCIFSSCKKPYHHLCHVLELKRVREREQRACADMSQTIFVLSATVSLALLQRQSFHSKTLFTQDSFSLSFCLRILCLRIVF